MTASRFKSRLRTATDLVLNRTVRSDVHYVVENAAWSIRHDGLMITQNLSELKGRITVHPMGIKNSIMHFGSINTWLRRGQAPRKVHDSNKVVVTWFHVEEGDPRIERLSEVQHEADLWHTSCSITEKLLSTHGVEPDRIRRIPLGVNTDLFTPVEGPAEKIRIREMLGIPTDMKVIGSFQKDGVGWGEGLEPKMVKGPDILCDTLEEISKNEEIFVLLTGPSRGYVCRRLEEAGIRYMHRNIPHPDLLIPFYRALDLYLISSRAEGGPKPLLEAMACGIPVVTTPVGMVVDLVGPEKQALVGSSTDLPNLGLSILSDTELSNQMSLSGRKVVEPLNWPNIAQRYQNEIYSKV